MLCICKRCPISDRATLGHQRCGGWHFENANQFVIIQYLFAMYRSGDTDSLLQSFDRSVQR